MGSARNAVFLIFFSGLSYQAPHIERLRCQIWNLGHSRSGKVSQHSTNVLPRIKRGNCCVWYYKTGTLLFLNFAFYYFEVWRDFFVLLWLTDPFLGWEHGGSPWIPSGWATPHGSDQRSYLEMELPKSERRKEYVAGHNRIRWRVSWVDCPRALHEGFSILKK